MCSVLAVHENEKPEDKSHRYGKRKDLCTGSVVYVYVLFVLFSSPPQNRRKESKVKEYKPPPQKNYTHTHTHTNTPLPPNPLPPPAPTPHTHTKRDHMIVTNAVVLYVSRSMGQMSILFGNMVRGMSAGARVFEVIMSVCHLHVSWLFLWCCFGWMCFCYWTVLVWYNISTVLVTANYM